MDKVLMTIINTACYLPQKVMRNTPRETIAWSMRGFHVGINAYCGYICLYEPMSPLRMAKVRESSLYISYIVFMILAQFFYLLSSFLDPGYLTKEEMLLDKAETSSKDNDIDIESGEHAFKGLLTRPLLNMSERAKCEPCGWDMPLRTIHCRTCGKCVRRYDHHCPWIGNCVGEKNYRFFYLFIHFQSLVVFILAYSCYFSFYDTVTNWFWFHRYLLLCTVVMAISVPTGIALMAFHNYMVITAQTSHEVVKHSQIPYLQSFPIGMSPFNQGIIRNYYLTFLRWRPILWENLYRL